MTKVVFKPDLSHDRIAFGRYLFAQKCEFFMGAYLERQLPLPKLPEIAFVGRSNVGKSTLVNALTGRKTLARTSNSPGRTREVNFFNLASRILLVDLPGYGYARAPKREISRWNRLVENYLRGRSTLIRVSLLIDGRHGFKQADRDTMEILDDSAVSYQVILTKTDKAKASEIEQRVFNMSQEMLSHPAAHPKILLTSATNKEGLEEVRAEIASLASAEIGEYKIEHDG